MAFNGCPNTVTFCITAQAQQLTQSQIFSLKHALKDKTTHQPTWVGTPTAEPAQPMGRSLLCRLTERQGPKCSTPPPQWHLVSRTSARPRPDQAPGGQAAPQPAGSTWEAPTRWLPNTRPLGLLLLLLRGELKLRD